MKLPSAAAGGSSRRQLSRARLVRFEGSAWAAVLKSRPSVDEEGAVLAVNLRRGKRFMFWVTQAAAP